MVYEAILQMETWQFAIRRSGGPLLRGSMCVFCCNQLTSVIIAIVLLWDNHFLAIETFIYPATLNTLTFIKFFL